MNNQQDPAVEAALEKAEKLLNQDPQLRRELYLKLIAYASLLTIAISALIAINQYLQYISSTEFKSSINLFSAVANGAITGYIILLYIVMLAQLSKKSIGPKLMVAIKNEFCDFDVPQEYTHKLFDKKEVYTLLNFKKRWAWLNANFYILLSFLFLLVGFQIFSLVSLSRNWLDLSYEMGLPIQVYQIVIAALIGVFLGLLASISFLKTFITILCLFSPKTYWLIYNASLLEKIRIIKTEYAKWKADEEANAEPVIANQ